MRISVLLGLLAFQSLPAMAAEPVLVPPAEAVAGASQSEWSRRWWQWAGSFDHADSPVADRTGALCGHKQGEDVWFLAGTYGTRRTVRTCTVPRGKHLFFPLINYVVHPQAEGASSCMQVMGTAARITEQVSNLLLEVDGVRHTDLEKHRQATVGCFDLGALAEPKARIFPAAANGYYVMLKPLPPGKHVLNFGGVLPSMAQAVTYTIVVE